MAKRYWIYGPKGGQVGGPFETEAAASECVRILNEETGLAEFGSNEFSYGGPGE